MTFPKYAAHKKYTHNFHLSSKMTKEIPSNKEPSALIDRVYSQVFWDARWGMK